MTDFTISIVDQAQLDGIAHVREVYNAANPDNPLKDDAAYFAMAAAFLFAQYERDKSEHDLAEAIEAAKAGDPSKLRDCADTTAKAANDKPVSPQPSPGVLIKP